MIDFVWYYECIQNNFFVIINKKFVQQYNIYQDFVPLGHLILSVVTSTFGTRHFAAYTKDNSEFYTCINYQNSSILTLHYLDAIKWVPPKVEFGRVECTQHYPC